MGTKVNNKIKKTKINNFVKNLALSLRRCHYQMANQSNIIFNVDCFFSRSVGA